MPDLTCSHLAPVGHWCRKTTDLKCPATLNRVGCPFAASTSSLEPVQNAPAILEPQSPLNFTDLSALEWPETPAKPSRDTNLHDNLEHLKANALRRDEASARVVNMKPRAKPAIEAEPLEPAPTLNFLESRQAEFGPAWPTVLALARACLSHATTARPAPHYLTVLWTLAEMTGHSERTVQRHLLEDAHTWSSAVEHFFDFRPNYDTMPTPGGGSRKVISGTVVRFFPQGRTSPNAKVKRWTSRDLANESEQKRTKPSRAATPESMISESPSQTQEISVSLYRSVREQIVLNNWLFVCIEALSEAQTAKTDNLYDDTLADISKNALPDAMFADLELILEDYRERGEATGKARAAWVRRTAGAFAGALRDMAFTRLWQRLLWVALRAEQHGGTRAGFWYVKRVFHLAVDAQHDSSLSKPTAWALSTVRKEGLLELERDYAEGMIGPKPHQFVNA
jgi:hypothetical protein